MKLHRCLIILLAGCSSSSASMTPPEPDGSSDASIPTDASPDRSIPTEASTVDAAMPGDAVSDDAGADAGAPCNAIANEAPVVDVIQIAAAPPAPQGGIIVDGTYWQTALAIYTGPSGPAGRSGTSQMTAQIRDQTVQIVSAGQPERRTVTLMTSDAGFTSVDTCPDVGG
jgi:hypothetical protein